MVAGKKQIFNSFENNANFTNTERYMTQYNKFMIHRYSYFLNFDV